MRRFRLVHGVLALCFLLCLSPLAQAGIFAGPLSDYYLTDITDSTIYVVQGTGVVFSFPMHYGSAESPIAISDNTPLGAVRTTGGMSDFGGGYLLDGAPTGNLFGDNVSDFISDGTSNGLHNYTVNVDGQVYQTGLDWQNASKLFTADASDYWWGITYDPTNDSLWLSGYYQGGSPSSPGSSIIVDYTMSGGFLSYFGTPTLATALGYDPADNTLWSTSNLSNTLVQFSTSGALLQSGIPLGLPSGDQLPGGELETPEPASLSLLACGVAGLLALGARRLRARE